MARLLSTTRIHQSYTVAQMMSNIPSISRKNFADYSGGGVPAKVIQMPDGAYIGTRKDFQYGLMKYSPSDKSVTELPSGYDFEDIDHPDSDQVSMHVMEYNQKNDVLAELYGCFPTVILRDGKGNVTGTLTYKEYSPDKDEDGAKYDCFCGVCLTDNHIWLLFGDEDKDDPQRIFVLDYNGDPIADLEIEPASTFRIDPRNRLILTVNPNCDEANVKVYEIPSYIDL